MYVFFRCVAEAVAEAGVRGLAEEVPGGKFFCDVAEKVRDKYRARKKDGEIRAEVQQIANTNSEQARIAAAEAARGVAKDEDIIPLELYLSAVPAAVRQSLKRVDDPSGTTVPATFSLATSDDVLQMLPPRLTRFRPGDPLSGKPGWVLVEPLGVGGFGEVWLAKHTRVEALRGAVKFCHLLNARDRELLHESRVIDQVMTEGKHPNIVPLIDVNQDSGIPWLMYEYVPGGDLADWTRRLQQYPSEKRIAQAVTAMRQLAKAVAYFHRLRPAVIHRDLKPSNILLDRVNKQLRITDFGIGTVAASAALAEESRTGGTRGGRLLSYLRGSYTPLYSSPQQRDGADPDPRDDVHALGVIGYQLVTGHLNQGAGPDFADDLRDVGTPEPLIALLGRCTAQKAERRPTDAGELAKLLEMIAAVAPNAATAPVDPMARSVQKPAEADAKEIRPVQREGTGSKLGIITSIIEYLTAASENEPVTKSAILAKLRDRFPDRNPDAMRRTINTQVPSQLRTEKGIIVEKNERGYWIDPTKERLQPSERKSKRSTDERSIRYPKWVERVTPHTDSQAKISLTRFASNVRAIRVENGMYRNATLTGTFELADPNSTDPVEITPGGRCKVKVVCAWHGVTPPTTYPNLDLSNGRYEIIDGYTGNVADDIS